MKLNSFISKYKNRKVESFEEFDSNFDKKHKLKSSTTEPKKKGSEETTAQKQANANNIIDKLDQKRKVR